MTVRDENPIFVACLALSSRALLPMKIVPGLSDRGTTHFFIHKGFHMGFLPAAKPTGLVVSNCLSSFSLMEALNEAQNSFSKKGNA